MDTKTLLIIILIVILVGAFPAWPHSKAWGPYPSGIIGVVLLVILIAALAGRL